MGIKKAELTVETWEVLVIRERRGLARSFCSSCGRQVLAISLNDAYASGLSAEVIRQEVETGRFHLIEPVGKSSLICLNSLNHI